MDKLAVTNEIIHQLKLELDPEHAMRMWFWPDSCGRANARLTKPGLAFISKIAVGYKFDFEFSSTGAILTQLAKMNTAYYVDNGGIVIFSEQVAVIVKMYPSFTRYLELIQ